jgi:hypothetical protein
MVPNRDDAKRSSAEETNQKYLLVFRLCIKEYIPTMTSLENMIISVHEGTHLVFDNVTRRYGLSDFCPDVTYGIDGYRLLLRGIFDDLSLTTV